MISDHDIRLQLLDHIQSLFDCPNICFLGTRECETLDTVGQSSIMAPTGLLPFLRYSRLPASTTVMREIIQKDLATQ